MKNWRLSERSTEIVGSPNLNSYPKLCEATPFFLSSGSLSMQLIKTWHLLKLDVLQSWGIQHSPLEFSPSIFTLSEEKNILNFSFLVYFVCLFLWFLAMHISAGQGGLSSAKLCRNIIPMPQCHPNTFLLSLPSLAL